VVNFGDSKTIASEVVLVASGEMCSNTTPNHV